MDSPPTVGYAMVFEPTVPLQYTNRIRVILYNNLKSNRNVYGKDLIVPKHRYHADTGSPSTHGWAPLLNSRHSPPFPLVKWRAL